MSIKFISIGHHHLLQPSQLFLHTAGLGLDSSFFLKSMGKPGVIFFFFFFEVGCEIRCHENTCLSSQPQSLAGGDLQCLDSCCYWDKFVLLFQEADDPEMVYGVKVLTA